MNTKEKIGLGAAIAAIIGAVLPWATIGPFSVDGTSGDGKLTLIAGVITALIVFTSVATWAELFGGGVIGGVAVYDLARLSQVAHGPFGLSASPGSGLILTLVAGSVLVGIAVWAGFERVMAGHEFKDA